MNEQGFTLAELVVSMMIMGMVVSSIVVIQQRGQEAFLWGAGRTDAQQNARVALERITRELRLGGRQTPGNPGIVTAANCGTVAGSSDITFIYINDRSPAQEVTVRYWRNGTNLQRNQTNPVPAAPQPETVIAGLQGLSFQCFAADGVTLTNTAAAIRVVDVTLTVQMQDSGATGHPANQRIVAQDRVRMRNL